MSGQANIDLANPQISNTSTKPEKPGADLNPESFKILLKKLVQHPNEFQAEDCAQCFRHICVQGTTDAQVGIPPSSSYLFRQHQAKVKLKDANSYQAGAFLTALTLSGKDSDPTIVAACASILRQHAIAVKDLGAKSGALPKEDEWDYRETDKDGDGYTGCVDIVGTGGDGWDTFNVSTTAAVVVAGAGVRVTKVSSSSTSKVKRVKLISVARE